MVGIVHRQRMKVTRYSDALIVDAFEGTAAIFADVAFFWTALRMETSRITTSTVAIHVTYPSAASAATT